MDFKRPLPRQRRISPNSDEGLIWQVWEIVQRAPSEKEEELGEARAGWLKEGPGDRSDDKGQ